ncbi:MAG: hypothetical protein H3C34_20930, partial [Caldilineaceae bacterium]|nr:hypothetical protein [Caldilineaceae bacterium]
MSKPLPLLRLLGPLQLQSTSGENLSLRLRKAEALLAYLAVQTQPVSRRVVADLLWADSPPQRRRANLSLALHAIGQVLPHCIEATAAELLLPPSAPLHIDTRLFATFSADGDPVAFSRAVSHYRGEFLEGFYLDGCPDFETWIIVQREQWRLQVVELLERLFHHHLERAEYDRSIDAGLRLLTIEPWREESHRRMMLVYAVSGQRSSALAQFESCRRLLRSELGVDPLPETVRLYEQIQRNEIGAPQQVAVKTTWTNGVQHNLPMPLTSFVQSGTLLADIAARLRSSDCRLLTLTGPGGVGKTRAGIEAAMQMADTAADLFADGIYFIRTAHIKGEEALLSTIADSVGFTFVQSASPWDQLLSFLAPRRLLLVIDNFEPLVELTPRVVALLRSCPHLKLLITSRIRLQVSGEWVLTVEGLRYPPSGETLPLPVVKEASQPSELGDLQDSEAWDAVRLFAHRARQVEPSFELTPETLPAVIRICQLLEGLPLGLELAASWVPLLSCQEIVAEIERSLDFLVVPPATSPSDDRPSLAAVFEQTWQMLDDAERRTLRRLSVFHGGFDRYAAEQITGASLLTLSTLVRKSILQRNLSGRMALLAVLHRYAEIRLAADLDEWRETQRRHAAYYAAFVQARTRMLASKSHARAVSELTEEIRNIRLAWQHAVAWRMLPALGRMATGLALYYEIRGWFQEARHAYTIAVDMPSDGDIAEERYLRGILASHLGRFLMRLGDHVGAEAVLRRSVALL